MVKIYVIGSHSVGKTTFVDFISDHYSIPKVGEGTRDILEDWDKTLKEIRCDLDLVNKFQRKIFNKKVRMEKSQEEPFVADRGFDNIAYFCQHGTEAHEMRNEIEDYIDWMKKDSIIFFFRPSKKLIEDDEVREDLRWESVVRIDGMIKFILEYFGFDYIPVQTDNFSERARIVKGILDDIFNHKT